MPNVQAILEVKPSGNKPGTPIITEVKILKSEADADGRRVFTAKLPGRKDTFLILNPPTIVRKPGPATPPGKPSI